MNRQKLNEENITHTQHEISAMTVDQFQTACETNNIDCDSIDDMVYDLAKALTRSSP